MGAAIIVDIQQWAEEISQRIYFICVVGGNPICGKEWQWYVCQEKVCIKSEVL